tara:strand:- start:78220 stop:78999 length:780 start_codon:yes stop_codon:yes gene_type:complete
MSNIELTNSVVFITGTNRENGIGRALVDEIIKRGAKKVYVTARDVTQLEDVVAKHEDIVVPISLDVTSQHSIDQAASVATDVQILINNAGACGFSGYCFDYISASARQEFEVNYWGPLHLIQAFKGHLISHPANSAIVNICSLAGLSAFPLTATYSASKAALHSLTQTVRAELALYGIKVFGVYPGPIDTDMANEIKMTKETPAYAAARIFDGMVNGIETITTDKFGDDFVEQLRDDPHQVEKNLADLVQQLKGATIAD